MSKEPTNRELLEAAAKRTAEAQPDEIRLSAAPDHAWINSGAVEAYAAAIRALGFEEAGVYTVDVLPVASRFLLKQSDQIYATIYEHPKAGVWINFVVLYEEDASLTFTNTHDRGLEKRPGHPIVYSPGAPADQLFAAIVQQCPPGKRKALSPASIIGEFERSWADSVRWRKSRGLSMTEVASVILSRGGQPARLLRPDRIQFVAEQDGVSERKLKASFAKIFDANQSVERAYLMNLRYDETPEAAVALCLISASPKDTELIDGIRKTFAALFPKGANLDILFLSASDVPRLERASQPFYVRTIH